MHSRKLLETRSSDSLPTTRYEEHEIRIAKADPAQSQYVFVAREKSMLSVFGVEPKPPHFLGLKKTQS